jgi:hypothetical protein
MSWVYEELEKSDLQLEFPLEEVVAPFERHIEERLSQYMVWRVFGHKADEETKWELYSTDVWGFVHDEVLMYHRKNPKLFNLLSKCGSCNAWQQLNCDDLCKDCEAGVDRCPSCDKITRKLDEGVYVHYTCDVCKEQYFCDDCIDSVEEDQGNGETRLLHRCSECRGKERTEDDKTADAVAVQVAITWGDGEKSVAQAKEAIAKLEATLEKQVASNLPKCEWCGVVGAGACWPGGKGCVDARATRGVLEIMDSGCLGIFPKCAMCGGGRGCTIQGSYCDCPDYEIAGHHKLMEGVASNSSASASFVIPPEMKERMDAACEEAKASPAEEQTFTIYVLEDGESWSRAKPNVMKITSDEMERLRDGEHPRYLKDYYDRATESEEGSHK